MRTPPLLADFSHARACKPFCENSLTLPGAQYTDLQAVLSGIGGRRTDPAGALGDRSAEQDLCAGAEEAGLKKILRNGIMERKKSAPPYSEERREAARKFARERNSVERLKS